VAGTDLVALTAALVDVPSVSHGEAALAGWVADRLGRASHLQVARLGDTVVARTDLGRAQRLLLGGHLDTVPPSPGTPTLAAVDGDAVRGLGAVDMKGGLAVLLDLAESVVDPVVDVTYVLYACEEVARADNALAALARERPDLLRADAAILAEPTGGRVEAGCQGTVRAQLTVAGRRAHTARPWTGVNAVHRLQPVLAVLAGYEPRSVVLDGCTYTEQLQAVAVRGGVAGNVVPDRAELAVNFRFAPDRDEAAAVAELGRLLAPAIDAAAGDTLQVEDLAPGALPALQVPLLARLVAATGPPRAKVGWTDVATLAAAGVPATNFGPGDPLLAHTTDEVVTRTELEQARTGLAAVLTGG
jgi:succinyl-diaminopimelate desuccinylase